MPGHVLEDFPLPAEVLHELAGQFDRIPFDAVDARDAEVFDLRKQVVQPVAGFMEERDRVIVGEECRLAAHRTRKIAVEVGHRRLDTLGSAPSGDRAIHPGTAALGFACIEVEIELADEPARHVADIEKAYVFVPNRRSRLLDLDAVKRLNQLEHSGHDLALGEVLLHLLVRERIPVGAQFLRGVSKVPGLERREAELVPGEFAQFGEIFLCERARTMREVVEKIQHLLRRLRHLRHQRNLGKARVAEQCSVFFTQLENARDQRRVVPFGLAELGRAGCASAVKLFTQPAVFCVLHDRQVGRHLQGEFPACLGVLFRQLARRLDRIAGQAGQSLLVLDNEGVGIRSVEHVFGKLGRKRGELVLDRGIAGLHLRRQFCAAEPEIAQCVLHQFLASGGQRPEFRGILEGAVLVEQRRVLSQLGPELGDLRQTRVIGGAQLGAIQHRMQVLDLPPGAGQALGRILERAHERIPCRRDLVGGDGADHGARLREQLVDRRGDMLGLEFRKAGKGGKVEEGVHRNGLNPWFAGRRNAACSPPALQQSSGRRLRGPG